jgi:predicted permease
MDAAFALILTSLAAGFVCARLRVFPENAADVLNRFVIYVCLPALVLKLVPAIRFDSDLAVLVVTPWVLLAVGAGVVISLSRLFGFRREVTGALLLCVPLGNTSFLGFPMVGALLGLDAVRFAVLYDQLGSFFVLATYGLFVVARFSDGGAPTLRDSVLRVLRFPPFLSLVVALLPIRHPPLVDSVLGRLGDALVPLALFAVGLKLELRRPKDGLPLAAGLVTKMALFPLVAFGFGRVAGAQGLPLHVAVLESAMPPMITAGALAAMAGLAPELSTGLVGYGILASLATVPAVAALLR